MEKNALEKKSTVGNETVKTRGDIDRKLGIIVDALKKDNILLVATQECERNSALRRIQTLLKEKQEDYLVIFIDVNDVNTPGEFLIEILFGAFTAAENKNLFTETIKNAFCQKTELLESESSLEQSDFNLKPLLKEEITEDNWKEEGGNVFTFIQDYFNRSICIIIDDFTKCVHNLSRKDNRQAEIFLKFLRSTRAREDKIRFILSGSMGIHEVVMR